jgi:hypothetical protein
MKKLVLFFMFIAAISVSIFGSEQEKKSMKIFMLMSCSPTTNNVSAMNQARELVNRGHDVTIHYPFKEVDDFPNIKKDAIKYGLIDKMIFKLPASFDDYDIVYQIVPSLFNIKKSHNFKGKIVVCMHGLDIASHAGSFPDVCDHDLLLPIGWVGNGLGS